jgi:hypothetical protein
MGVQTSVVGYTFATARREDHEVHKEHVVALGGGGIFDHIWLKSSYNEKCARQKFSEN